MKVTTQPTEKVFDNLFLQNLEFLFLKKDIVLTKLSSENKIIAKVINALVKPTKSAKNTKALLADISEQQTYIDIKSQESD